MFDPYRKWLHIPKERQPPTHYQLLGISPAEAEPAVIQEASRRRRAQLAPYQSGPHAAECQQLLAQIEEAVATLLDPARRKAYDATRDTILQEIHSATDLPTIPAVVLQLDPLVRQDASATVVWAIVKNDVAMAANVLRLANSAFYGFGREIVNLKDAIAFLGNAQILSLCWRLSTTRLFGRPTPLIDYREFCRHSLAVAEMTRTIAGLAHRRDLQEDHYRDDAFTGGLLHEVGSYLFSLLFPDWYADLRGKSDAEHLAMPILEQRELGIDHAEMGAEYFEHWNYPAMLVASVRCHHEPERAEEGPERLVASLVHIADFATTYWGCGGPGEKTHPGVSEQAFDELGLYHDVVNEWQEAVQAAVGRADSFLSQLRAFS